MPFSHETQTGGVVGIPGDHRVRKIIGKISRMFVSRGGFATIYSRERDQVHVDPHPPLLPFAFPRDEHHELRWPDSLPRVMAGGDSPESPKVPPMSQRPSFTAHRRARLARRVESLEAMESRSLITESLGILTAGIGFGAAATALAGTRRPVAQIQPATPARAWTPQNFPALLAPLVPVSITNSPPAAPLTTASATPVASDPPTPSGDWLTLSSRSTAPPPARGRSFTPSPSAPPRRRWGRRVIARRQRSDDPQFDHTTPTRSSVAELVDHRNHRTRHRGCDADGSGQCPSRSGRLGRTLAEPWGVGRFANRCVRRYRLHPHGRRRRDG